MGVPGSDMQPADGPAADALLSAFRTIDDSGRSRHAAVLGYWLAIRGDREFPALHDLDPLEISDAGPCSVLLQLIGGGEDAEVRHLGDSLKTSEPVERIIDAPRPSILSAIAAKLSIVAISRNFLAFEDEFLSPDGMTRCWVTLLPLSSAGPWVDYVYAFATFEAVPADAAEQSEAPEEQSEPLDAPVDEVEAPAPAEAEELEIAPAEAEEPEPVVAEVEEVAEAEEVAEEEVAVVEEVEEAVEASDEPEADADSADELATDPGFSEMFHDPATADGFYGAATVRPAPARSPAPAAQTNSEEPAHTAEPAVAGDGPLHEMLAAVRAKADEARLAKLRSNSALYEGLSAAYDFALDAEDNPDEYLQLVQAQGLKIKLRSPMLPVMKLAFAGMCDDPTIARLEAVLAWALEQGLPRGSLAARIEEEGGISRILGGEASAS